MDQAEAGATSLPADPSRTQALAASPALRGWGAAVAVYLGAVLHRSSLGVAGLTAEHRFGISPGQLSVFVFLQLGAYAAMQVPAGVLVDRFGPRRLLLSAAATMALAQVLFALAPNYPSALVARLVLGIGDGLTYVSVLRFAALNFAPRRFPMIVSITGLLGSLGSIAATVPLSVALSGLGWAPTFIGAGVLSVLSGGLVWALLPSTAPPPVGRRNNEQRRAIVTRVGLAVRTAWANPGTRLAFWVHFSCVGATTVLTVLWGQPYLVSLGFSSSAASEVLLATVIVMVTGNGAVGWLASRYPGARVGLAVAVAGLSVLGWAVLLIFLGDHPPRVYVVTFIIAMAMGNPASAVAFSIVREHNPPQVVGTAVGVVNVGGYSATIICAVAVGALLDLAGVSDAPSFRAALIPVAALQLLGVLQTVRWWARVTRRRARVSG
jgi:MFS family permease